MFRRLFVSVLVAALALVITPRPSFGLDAADHKRCMYRCKERGLKTPSPQARLDAPVRPLRHNCLWCGGGHGGWGHGGWGHGGWGHGGHGGGWGGGWGHHRPWGGGWWSHPDWYDNGDDDRWHYRPRRWHRWNRWDRWHRWDRHRDPSRSSGYNHHREHPRSRDF